MINFNPVQHWGNGLNMNNERTFELEDVRSSGFMSEVGSKKRTPEISTLAFLRQSRMSIRPSSCSISPIQSKG